ncbi:MAG TPA: hypothetical protein VFE86_18320, partial [Ilumatobacteraceae bacterium]|nr:hypothetical protein [Ilumatobacteraceae bacterium]
MSGRLARRILAAALGVLSACSAHSSAESQTTVAVTVATGKASVAVLRWADCGEPLLLEGQCATLEVPVDARRPDGPLVGIALFRIRAKAARIGVLVVNPGGPGVSGIDYVRDAY